RVGHVRWDRGARGCSDGGRHRDRGGQSVRAGTLPGGARGGSVWRTRSGLVGASLQTRRSLRDYALAALRRLRVLAAFLAEADRAATGRAAEAAPPFRPPFFAGAGLVRLPRPDP